MVSRNNQTFTVSDLRGTYSAKGYPNLHILGVKDNEGIPTRVLELRDHFLQSQAKIFGRVAGEIETVAFWNSTEMLGDDIASLHHVGENVFYGEWMQLFEAYKGAEAVLALKSVSLCYFVPTWLCEFLLHKAEVAERIVSLPFMIPLFRIEGV